MNSNNDGYIRKYISNTSAVMIIGVIIIVITISVIIIAVDTHLVSLLSVLMFYRQYYCL